MAQPDSTTSLESNPAPTRLPALILSIILVAAGVLRLGWPDVSPTGVQIDEASNAWNAYCLLKTGHDEYDVSWPVYYAAALGDYRSPLYFYFLIPFQAVWGMTPYTTRLPAAVCGVASVALIYAVGKKWFGPAVGLTAAALLTINPWHLEQTRWGHESSIAPFLALAALAAMLAARLPLTDSDSRNFSMRPIPCFLAGLLLGSICYGYGAIRLFVPPFLLGCVLVTLPLWFSALKRRGNIAAIGCFVFGFAVPFGFLAYKHLTDPIINNRAHDSWTWQASDSLLAAAGKLLAHFLIHFQPSFLFIRGDQALSPPQGWGLFQMYEMPLMLCGLICVVTSLRRSYAARLLLIAVLVYPAGDTINGNINQPNALRSFVGMWSLELLAAVGAVYAWKLAGRLQPLIARTAAVAMVVWILISGSVFVTYFFGAYNRQMDVYRMHNTSMQQVCQWLKPRLQPDDTVFWTRSAFPFIYAPVLVYLQYDPQTWFHTRRTRTLSAENGGYINMILTRTGRNRFIYSRDMVATAAQESGHRIYFVVYPTEMPQFFKALPVSAVFAAVDPLNNPDVVVLEKPPQYRN